MVARANIQDSSRDWIDPYRRSLNERHFHSFQLFIDIKRREMEFFFLPLDVARGSKFIVNILAEAGFCSRKRNLSPRASVFFLQPCVVPKRDGTTDESICQRLWRNTAFNIPPSDWIRLCVCVCVYVYIHVYIPLATRRSHGKEIGFS